MNNQLKVSLENILPLTFARDHFSQIVSEVQRDKLFILTKGGKPAVAIIDVKYLESLTGGQIQRQDISDEIKKAPEKVGLPPMVEHPTGFSSMPPKTTPPVKPFSPPPRPYDDTQNKPVSPPNQPKTFNNRPFNHTPEKPPENTRDKPAGFAASQKQEPKEEKKEPFENTQGKPPLPYKPAGFAAPQPKPLDSARDKSGQAPQSDKPKPLDPTRDKETPPPPKVTPPMPKPVEAPMPIPIKSAPTFQPESRPDQSVWKPVAPVKTPSEPPSKPPEEKELTMPKVTESISNIPPKDPTGPTGIPNKPLTTLPPVNTTPEPATSGDANQVDVEFSPDAAELDDKGKDGKMPDGQKTDPDDKEGPAQYAGEPSGGEPEPEDMVID